jgi:hypothetical protein
MKKVAILEIVLAVLLMLSSVYCFLWVFSSSSLAFLHCNGNFSMTHADMRCRQPQIATILWLVLGVTSIMLFVVAFRTIHKRRITGEISNSQFDADATRRST